jgi:predicted acetyltransferase
MKLKLIKANIKFKREITDMLDEWYASVEKIIPYAIRRADYHSFEEYCESLEIRDTSDGRVPDSTLFCLDEERNVIVGALNIRHYLTESLLIDVGHIGGGVRPSERKKGISTRMLALALEECKKLGIERVLMVCDKANIGSAKSIQKNGGILENELTIDGVIKQRYWIELI